MIEIIGGTIGLIVGGILVYFGTRYLGKRERE